MQRVVRSSLVGLLTLASLTACGDKVTVPQATTTTTAPSTVVRGVTITPASASMAVGDKLTFSASVNADAGVTDRTVTWSSTDATVASVDANGVVTALKAGTTSIIAKSKADATVSASSTVTVGATGGGAPAIVTISNLNTTRCDVFGGCTSVPANLGAVAGQIDVTLNVDPGSARLLGVDLIMNCTGAGNSGQDTVVVSQTLATANVAPEASEASAPVTLSFNTATFNGTTGATAFKNGACTLKARARTSAGNTLSTSQNITLANADVVIGAVTPTKTATDAAGLSWVGGNVTISAIPVFYTAGRTAASASITFEGKTAASLTATGGAFSATFNDTNDPASTDPLSIEGITDRNAASTINVAIVDNTGNQFTNLAACGTSVCTAQSVLAGAPAPANPAATPLRLDTQKPLPGTFQIKQNPAQLTSSIGYVNGNFRFAADSAAGYCGPNSTGYTAANNGTGTPVCTGAFSANRDSVTLFNAAPAAGAPTGGAGVDRVTVTFQTRVTGAASSTYTTQTSASSLNETTQTTGNTNSYQLRMITADALGNADTTTVGTFGVDKTAPTVGLAGGPANQAQFTVAGASGNYVFAVSDNLSGPSIDAVNGGAPRALVAQTRLWNGLNPANYDVTTFENKTYSNTGAPAVSSATATADLSPCTIGRFNAAQSAAGPNALAAYDRSGTLMGYCTPVFYDMPGNVIPAAAPGTTGAAGGYYMTEVIAVDQAGNRAPVFTSTIVEDPAAPAVSGIDMPGSITGNSTVTFPASATDNLDVVGSYAVVGYPSMNLRYPTVAGPGVAFDNVLTRTATVSPTVTNFIRTLNVAVSGGNQTSTVTPNATNVTVAAIDEVGQKSTTGAVPFAPGVSLGTETSTTFSTSAAGAFNGGFLLASDNGQTVWNCPAATAGQTTGCGAAGTTTPGNTSLTFTATAGGMSGGFNNPFAVVQFWYQNGAGEWVLFGTSTSSSVSDNGSVRTWNYSFTWDPPATGSDLTSLTPAPGGTIALPIRAIGINSSGDAVYTSNAFTLTIQN